jgi:hypothetical protein
MTSSGYQNIILICIVNNQASKKWNSTSPWASDFRTNLSSPGRYSHTHRTASTVVEYTFSEALNSDQYVDLGRRLLL